MWDNLSVYESIIMFEDGEEVPFTGKDYFFIEHVGSDEVNVFQWYQSLGQWAVGAAEFIGFEDGYAKFMTDNPAGEMLTFLISGDKRDVIISKDDSDIVVGYEVVATYPNSSGSYSPSTGGYGISSGSYGNSFNNNSGYGNSSSGRTCISCNGTGKCKTCNGKGEYYHETGYYTGNSGKTLTTCPVCRGTGRCGTCHGNGSIH